MKLNYFAYLRLSLVILLYLIKIKLIWVDVYMPPQSLLERNRIYSKSNDLFTCMEYIRITSLL